MTKKIRGALGTLEILGQAPLLRTKLAHTNSHQLEGPTQCGGQKHREEMKGGWKGGVNESSKH